MTTTIYNVTNETKRSLTAVAAYDQICSEAKEKGITHKNQFSIIRIELSKDEFEYLSLKKKLQTGFFSPDKRPEMLALYEEYQVKVFRGCLVTNLYSSHTRVLKDMIKVPVTNAKVPVTNAKVPVTNAKVPVTNAKKQKETVELSDDWEVTADAML